MEEELKTNFDNITVVMVEGEYGVFDIIFNDELIFSKGKDSLSGNRFPRRGEITGLIEKQMGESAGG